MTNQLVPANPHFLALQAATAIKDPSDDLRFPRSISDAGIAETYFIVHRDGNGASTLALFLEVFLSQEPLIAEVGTNLSRALQSVTDVRRTHITTSDSGAVSAALDWRLKNPALPAIIEFGKLLYKEAIEAALKLSGPPFNAHVPFLFLANQHDKEFKVADLARRSGLKKVLIFGEADGLWKDHEQVIPIPRLVKDLGLSIYQDGMSLGDALRNCNSVFSRTLFFSQFKEFGLAVKEGLAQ